MGSLIFSSRAGVSPHRSAFRVRRDRGVSWAVIALTIFAASCSTTQVEPLPQLPEPPKYVQVPHPEGLDHGDLMGIFAETGAPSPASLKGCEVDHTKLRKSTVSREELAAGARELVKSDPEKYHWCFYGVIWNLEEQVKTLTYIDERQKAIIEAYLFLTPIAKAFNSEFQDSRYMRWAVTRYRRFSEYVFYRRLEPTPQMNSELVGTSNPFGSLRAPASVERNVLQKYGIVPDSADTAKAALKEEAGNPVAEDPRGPLPVPATPAQPSKPHVEIVPDPVRVPVSIEPEAIELNPLPLGANPPPSRAPASVTK